VVSHEHHLRVTRTARYFTLGAASAATREVWFVLHGYAQLAEHFIRSFRSLDDGRRVIVAPEALSRFYPSGTNGHVGASWMTKVDRLAEIDDYVAYLDALAAETLHDMDRSNVRIVVLGFSQGAATAARWASRGAVGNVHLVLWGGNVASEIDLDSELRAVGELMIVLGSSDEYRSEEIVESERDRLARSSVRHRWIEYDGTHRIDSRALGVVAEAIAASSAPADH
jgi:predicted esterase